MKSLHSTIQIALQKKEKEKNNLEVDNLIFVQWTNGVLI